MHVRDGSSALTTRRRKTTPSAAAAPKTHFPVVGIGASAGGLAAIEEFLSALPADRDLGMAFVLVQHLDPDHKSLLLDLVSRYTRMKIAWVEDGVAVQPGRVYVMPPNKDMALLDGRLRLMEPEAPRGRRLPIDGFFRSLAAGPRRARPSASCSPAPAATARSACAPSRARAAWSWPRRPRRAAYDGMPRSAIATGLVDYVLPPARCRRSSSPTRTAPSGAAPAPRRAADRRGARSRASCVLLRERTGHDFSSTSARTIRRRIERRMAVTQVETMDDYARILQRRPGGDRDAVPRAAHRRHQLLPRPGGVRGAATKVVVPELVAAQDARTDPVRVWVPGCSTGEEAYSLAMLLQEHAEDVKRHVPDPDLRHRHRRRGDRARARRPLPRAASPPTSRPERLARFFVAGGRRLPGAQDHPRPGRVRRAGRDQGPAVLAPRPGQLPQPAHLPGRRPAEAARCRCSTTRSTTAGTCSWASSETRRRRSPTASPPSTRSGRSTGAVRAPARRPRIASTMPEASAAPLAGLRTRDRREAPAGARGLAERALLEQHAPAGVIVNAEGDVLYFHGRTGRYLEPAAGRDQRPARRHGPRGAASASSRRACARR